MTVKGENLLKEELQLLKTVERPNVINAIAEARAHGDLKENAEYHAAKERQGFIEARIRDIEYKLSLAQVIDISLVPKSDKVVFGATVTLLNTDTSQKVVYKIVGEDEADLKQGKVSVGSPISRALVAKSVGDFVNVQAPGGVIEYEIEAVEYIKDN